MYSMNVQYECTVWMYSMNVLYECTVWMYNMNVHAVWMTCFPHLHVYYLFLTCNLLNIHISVPINNNVSLDPKSLSYILYFSEFFILFSEFFVPKKPAPPPSWKGERTFVKSNSVVQVDYKDPVSGLLCYLWCHGYIKLDDRMEIC